MSASNHSELLGGYLNSEPGGVICLNISSGGAVGPVAVENEGVRAWFVTGSLGVVVMFKFVNIFELSW